MQKKRIFSYAFIVLGISLIATNISLTGAFIGTSISTNYLSFLGLLFLLTGGVLLGMAQGRELKNETGLVKVVTVPRFEKLVKKQPSREIEKALRNIGTGKGKEEFLNGDRGGEWAIRVNKGARILFNYNSDHTEAYVIGYTTDHNYGRA